MKPVDLLNLTTKERAAMMAVLKPIIRRLAQAKPLLLCSAGLAAAYAVYVSYAASTVDWLSISIFGLSGVAWIYASRVLNNALHVWSLICTCASCQAAQDKVRQHFEAS